MDKEQDMEEALLDAELEKELEEDSEDDIRAESIEDEGDMQDELADIQPGAVPYPEEQQNSYAFLKSVLDSPDRFKTGYLTWEELGKPTFPIRYWINLANTCQNLYSLSMVSIYCMKKAHITSDTSLSRDGFIITTSVTQKKVREKKGSSGIKELLAARGKI